MTKYMVPKKLDNLEKQNKGNTNIRAWLFEYHSLDDDYMVQVKADSLNDALTKFASHYQMIDKIYKISEVF